ncbi:winged helix-turn-helix transcriptional regulator [Cellulomonas sp. H30R-01]|nr:MarR family winged helix-turn-helix transcriptional regulator [Cellulomonas sp. H30R-01]QHT55929.1 winged helix-turn-helix transcriptional regulator [Cellulomonas sp. H30R-01]
MDVSTAPARLRALPTWLLNQAARRASGVVAERMRAAGSHRSHYAMLAALDERGALSQADLGRLVGLDRSDVAGAVADLLAAGVVDRRPDPDDRRRNSVALTPAGRRRLAELHDVVLAAQDDVLAPLDPDERAQLLRLLARLAGAPLPDDEPAHP